MCFEDFVEKLKETLKMPVIVEEKLFNFRSSLKKNNAKGMNMGSNSEPLYEILVSFFHIWGSESHLFWPIITEFMTRSLAVQWR